MRVGMYVNFGFHSLIPTFVQHPNPLVEARQHAACACACAHHNISSSHRLLVHVAGQDRLCAVHLRLRCRCVVHLYEHPTPPHTQPSSGGRRARLEAHALRQRGEHTRRHAVTSEQPSKQQMRERTTTLMHVVQVRTRSRTFSLAAQRVP